MTKVNHRYLTDKNGEIYFPKVHVEALLGIEDTDSENPFIDINNKIYELEEIIEDQQKVIEENKKFVERQDRILSDMIGDTGWIEYQVPPDMKNKAVSSGFKCAIREVRAGNDLIGKHFVVRSIRLNMSEIIEASMQIAQLPTGFITDNQSFIARQNGYRHPITIECLKDGKVMAFVHPDDQGKKNWVYQEFTWLE
ncbi:hypothetical protein [Staphylococcus shinii]|uniref:hypothetical protein n=1 Tax=Staphylococcus shinii TaxID=2912228 RepID=UPI003D80095B